MNLPFLTTVQGLWYSFFYIWCMMSPFCAKFRHRCSLIRRQHTKLDRPLLFCQHYHLRTIQIFPPTCTFPDQIALSRELLASNLVPFPKHPPSCLSSFA